VVELPSGRTSRGSMSWEFHIVRWQEEGKWLACPVEIDLVAQADNPEDLAYNLKHLLAGHVVVHREMGLEGDPFDHLPVPDLGETSENETLTLTVDGPYLLFSDGTHFTTEA